MLVAESQASGPQVCTGGADVPPDNPDGDCVSGAAQKAEFCIKKDTPKMNYTRVKQLCAERTKAHADAVSYLRMGLTTQNRENFDKAMAQVESLTAAIQGEERESFAPTAPINREQRAKHYEAFNRYLRGGMDNLTPEMRQLLNERRDQIAGQQSVTATEGPSGGYLVPPDFSNEIETATRYYCPMLNSDCCRTITTATGAVLPWPTSDDTSTEAEIVGEAQPADEGGLTFGSVSFGAHKLSSKLVKVSSELLQDSAFDIFSYLSDRFGTRYGRGLETLLTRGRGAAYDEPSGFLPAIADSGAEVVTAIGSAPNDGLTSGQVIHDGTNSIGSQDLVNLEHGVDPSYRRNAKYILNDKTLGMLQGLLDKFGRPLWTPALTANAPATINGYQYVINQKMDSVAPSAVTIAFGDWSKFVVRKVSTPSVKRLSELYAVSDMVGFISFQRIDSRLIDAGTHPLNVLVQQS